MDEIKETAHVSQQVKNLVRVQTVDALLWCGAEDNLRVIDVVLGALNHSFRPGAPLGKLYKWNAIIVELDDGPLAFEVDLTFRQENVLLAVTICFDLQDERVVQAPFERALRLSRVVVDTAFG